MTFRFYCPHSK